MEKRGRTAYITQCECFGFPLGAAGAGVGSASTAVLRWTTAAAVPPVPTSTDIVVTDSATAGMSFALNQPGSYHISMMLQGVASTTLRAGFSLNAAVSPLVANPVIDVDGVFAAALQTLPAATVIPMFLSAVIRIEPSEVGAILRMHATDNANATPVAAILSTASWMRIVRTNDGG